jgi:hypothetical protein
MHPMVSSYTQSCHELHAVCVHELDTQNEKHDANHHAGYRKPSQHRLPISSLQTFQYGKSFTHAAWQNQMLDF